LAATVTTPVPIHIGADRLTVSDGNRACQSFLNVLPQRLVGGQLRYLGTLGFPLGVPLCRRRAIFESAAARRRIPSPFARNRRRRTLDAPSDLTDAEFLGVQERDLFPFSKGQVAPRKRRQVGRWHAALLAEPPRSNRLRDAGFECCIPARRTARDGLPELLPMVTTSRRRTTW